MSDVPMGQGANSSRNLAGTLAIDQLEAAIAAAPPIAHRLLIWEPDPEMHAALHQAVGRQGELWETTVVRTASQLRDAMDDQPFDVVLADVRAVGPMASQLAEVEVRAPWALRVVMGRPGDEAIMVDAIAAAHRFVARPVDLPTLLDDLAATLRRRHGLRDVDALRIAFADTALPAAPGVWVAMQAALEDPNVGAAEMGAIVETDVAVAARTLSLANSAWFGLPRRVTDVRDAVVLLGGDAVQALVLAAELSSLVGNGVDPAWLLSFEAHAAEVARVARVVAPPRLRRDAVAACLLHDIGTLVLMRHHPRVMRVALDMDHETRQQLEIDLVGATHAEVGAMLLDAWGLPDSIIDAVLDHHRPPMTLRGELTLAGVVHIADAIARDPLVVAEDGITHLDDLHLDDRLEGWFTALEADQAR